MNVKTYSHCIYCKVKTRIQGEKYHTLRSKCACVWIYMVANLILLCSLKHISLDWNLENTLQENMRYLIHLFFSLFSGGHLRTHCFQYLEYLSIFFNTFSLNNFCIATCLFSAIETFQERFLQELRAFILLNLFLCQFLV